MVTLEALHRYCAGKDDDRSRFRARILEQTIRKYEASGIQTIDPNMTRFRAMYAAACDASLRSGRWWYEPPRDAWWDDNWFLFRAEFAVGSGACDLWIRISNVKSASRH